MTAKKIDKFFGAKTTPEERAEYEQVIAEVRKMFSEEQPRPSSVLVNVPVEEWTPLEQGLNPDLLSDLVALQGLEKQ
jgi:hypothetical protein